MTNSCVRSVFNPCVRDALTLLQKTASAFDGEAHVYVAGGIAVAWWLQGKNEVRTTLDIDAIFEGKVKPDAVIPAREGGVGLDMNFTDTLSLVDEEYPARAKEIAVFDNLHVHMIAPVDLILMKASRASPKDMEDIRRLISFVDKKEFKRLAKNALVIYIGNLAPVKTTLARIERLFPCQSFHP